MKERSHIVDFEELRKKKQLEMEHAYLELYQDFMGYLEANTNIREKVRARHLFKQLIGLNDADRLSPRHEELFSQWFFFDYPTVIGKTMFQVFLDKKSHDRTPSRLVIGAVMMAAVVEPIKVKRVNDRNETEFEDVDAEKSSDMVLVGSGQLFRGVSEGDVLFLRKVYSFNRYVAIGPFWKIPAEKSDDILTAINKDFKQYSVKDPQITKRAFLKMNAFKYIYNGMKCR